MIVPSLVPTKPCMIVNPRIRLRTDHMTSMINFTFPNGIPVLVCMASMRPSAASIVKSDFSSMHMQNAMMAQPKTSDRSCVKYPSGWTSPSIQLVKSTKYPNTSDMNSCIRTCPVPMSRPMRIFSTMITTTLQIIVHVPNVISGIMAEHVYGVAVNGELPISALTMRFTQRI